MRAQRILARRRWRRRIREIECAGWDHLYRLEGYDGLGNVRPWFIDYTPAPQTYEQKRQECRACEILIRCVRAWRLDGERLRLTDEWITAAYPARDEQVLSWVPFFVLDGFRHQDVICRMGYSIRPSEPVGIPRITQDRR